MSYTIIIPARYASTRLPGKALLDIAGKTMIQRVFEQATQCKANRVVIATDDQRIVDTVQAFGGEVCLTASTHESGTERLAEVVDKLSLDDNEIIVNIQGDEPLIPPCIVDQVAELLENDLEVPMATLAGDFISSGQIQDPNVVKVVCDHYGRALYFSRAPIPYSRNGEWPRDAFLKHIGIYSYRAGFIHKYISMQPSPIEQYEKLEQLRVLWYGYKINVAKALADPGYGVDTQEDIEKVREIIKQGL